MNRVGGRYNYLEDPRGARVSQTMDIVKVETLLVRKISKHLDLEPHHSFLFEISQQIQSLEASKVLAEMGHGCQAD